MFSDLRVSKLAFLLCLTYVYYNYKIIINRLLFEWDENKNRKNIIKHGISFEEASSVFLDDQAILFDDPAHSEFEERFLLIGMSSASNICIVCHCYRESDSVIRIISARKATKKEEFRYVKGI